MKKVIFTYIFIIFSRLIHAQSPAIEVDILYGEKLLKVGQSFDFSVRIKNSPDRPTVVFPELKGLTKGSMSTSTKTYREDGKLVTEYTVSQLFTSSVAGHFSFQNVQVTVNTEKIPGDPLAINFEASDDHDEGSDSEGFSEPNIAEGDIFLSVTSNKKQVYKGEGFTVRMALYISKSITLDMDFYKLDTQLENILKNLRPPSCWEENLGISEIRPRDVLIDKKKYTEYLIYQAVFYPITNESIRLPAVTLQMSANSSRRPTDEKTNLLRYRSRPLLIDVKRLPQHPLMNQVAVGDFSLSEKGSDKKLVTGESMHYSFSISGEGNIPAISPPLPTSTSFDFYPPETIQNIRKNPNMPNISGSKTFDYSIVARQQGVYPWRNFFYWVYFNPRIQQYDTLRSRLQITVSGESLSDHAKDHAQDLYANIDQLKTTDNTPDFQGLAKNAIIAVIAVMIVTMVWIFRK